MTPALELIGIRKRFGSVHALRGADCKRYLFHVEAQNTMMVRAAGRALVVLARRRG